MKKVNLYQPFEIISQELTEYPVEEHKHSFFELVYIISGTGLQCINNNVFSYKAGHLFLITPSDCHSFDIQESTQFIFIRFNDIYIKSNTLDAKEIQRLEFILNNANHQPGCILRNKSDKSFVKPLIDAIVREYLNHDLYDAELIRQIVNTIIIIVARNIAKYLPANINSSTETKALDILQYIQNYIRESDKIKSDVIANHFGISESYLGRYFKKHTNETMQQYIINYKLKLIESRLLHSDMRIGEIALEMGFSDESHMNKTFKKQNGISPSEYRKTKK